MYLPEVDSGMHLPTVFVVAGAPPAVKAGASTVGKGAACMIRSSVVLVAV
jgi:hypothetical protein